MATNRRCPAVFAGLVCGTLLVAPKVANAAIFQGTDAPLNPRYLVPGLISFGFGLFVGSLLGRQKDRSNNAVSEQSVDLDKTGVYEHGSQASESPLRDDSDTYSPSIQSLASNTADGSTSASLAAGVCLEDQKHTSEPEQNQQSLTSEYWDHYMPRHASAAQWDMYFKNLEDASDADDAEDVSDVKDVVRQASPQPVSEAKSVTGGDNLKSRVPEVTPIDTPDVEKSVEVTSKLQSLNAGTCAIQEEASTDYADSCEVAQEAVRDMANVLDLRLPQIYEEPKQTSADLTQAIFGHKQNSYEHVAEVYVDKKEEQKREQLTKKGVGSVLSERLGFIRKSKMDGIPVIQRADGTVGDVGTSWWDTSVSQDNMKHSSEGFADYLKVESDFTADNAMSLEHTGEYRATAASAFVQTKPKAANVYSPQEEKSQKSEAQAYASQDSRNRAQTINLMVPHIEAVRFPQNTAEKESDSWFDSLEAMDEGMYAAEDETIRRFDDIVGDDETLDEPEGLESKTAFMPFRVPAGHPEVRDMDSYIEYLLKQEFSKNTSKAVRRNAREYLKVIEGGTADVDKAKVAKALEDHDMLDDIKEA